MLRERRVDPVDLRLWLGLHDREQVELTRLESGSAQQPLDRLVRDTGLLLVAGEPLLVGGADQLSVDEQDRADIVVELGDAEDLHATDSPSSSEAVPAIVRTTNSSRSTRRATSLNTASKPPSIARSSGTRSSACIHM